MNKEKHVLGLSGGKDSAALAIFMRDNFPDLNIEYFFTDTGKELPEVYEYLSKLEGYLGKQIYRINQERDFDFWLMQNNNFLPSPRARWCTSKMKLKPFEDWISPFLQEGYRVYSYVAIRSDEEFREGYQSRNENRNAHRLICQRISSEHPVESENIRQIVLVQRNSAVQSPSPPAR